MTEKQKAKVASILNIPNFATEKASAALLSKIIEVVESGLEAQVPFTVYVHTEAPSRNNVAMLSSTMAHGTVGLESVKEALGSRSVNFVELDLGGELELEISAEVIGSPSFSEQYGKTGKGVIIAILDGLIDVKFPGFGERVVLKETFSPKQWDNLPPTNMFYHHGTLVAGIVGASGSSGGFKGVAPGVQLWNYRISPMPLENGNPISAGVYKAIRKAAKDGAHIINLSWGQSSRDLNAKHALCEAVEYARARGCIVVKSAGNNGSSTPPNITVPANSPSSVVVGSTTNDGTNMDDGSSWGVLEGGLKKPDLVAPGKNIDGPGFDGAHISKTGTSYAAPHVSGMLALLKEMQPAASADELVEMLLSTCRSPRGFEGGLERVGRGIPDLRRLNQD